MNPPFIRMFPDYAPPAKILHNGDEFILLLHPEMPKKKMDFQQPEYFTFIVVRNGYVCGTMDGTNYRANAPASIAILPRQHVHFDKFDPKADCVVYLLSTRLVQRIRLNNEFTVYAALQSNPVLQYTPAEMRILDDILQLQCDVLQHTQAEQLLDINAMLLHIGFHLLAPLRLRENAQGEQDTKRHELLTMRFTALLDQYYAQQHRVAWYASELCVAPKYLSESVKRATNHTAGWWIDHYLMRDATRMLRQGKLSVKTIAARLSFDDQSAFGKWFKRLKGVSPAHFRQN
ncbi:MAG: AraC family transcriptional regulator [Bacteroidales bacterium]|nr:AraC family transcriptional regulator [Bacteroidales bacterium]